MMHVQRDVCVYTMTVTKYKRHQDVRRSYTGNMKRGHLAVLQPQGVNLHIIKEGDKLQELSRVPTCYTNMNANLNVLFIPF